jgi:TatD DNase family protein
MFRGMYHGKRRHADDLSAVVDRARAAGVARQILTGTSLAESKFVLKLAEQYGEYLP